MKLHHWKNYEPITGITMFEDNDGEPTITDLQVIANLHASDAYPDPRITMVLDGLGSVGLTAKQSAALRGRLEQAERDVRSDSQPPVTAIGTEGRCEGCSRRIVAGQLVHVIDDGGGERVVVHAGQCPSDGSR